MVHSAVLLQTLTHLQLAGLRLAQASASIDTPEEASALFSGPQFFAALFSGLILAFGFQMLLTNLSVAIGVSVLSATSGSSNSSDADGSPVRTISIAVGLWTLITVTVALFAACFLAIKMGLFSSGLLGATTGLVIWALYFTTLVWISSTTVGSLIGSVVSTATSSFQSIMGTATAALGAKAVSNQVVATAEATAAAVRQELIGQIDPDDIQDKLQDYIKALRSPQLDLEGIKKEFDTLLKESDLGSVEDAESLQHIGRDAFVELVSSRTDLSAQEVDQVVDQLYGSWQQTVGKNSGNRWMQELVNYFQSAKPEQLLSEEVGQRLDQLLEEMKKGREAGSENSNLLNRVMPILTSVVMGRTDLSDIDVEKITEQIKSAKSHLTDQADQLAVQFSSDGQARSIVRADVENYLHNAYVWQLSPERLRVDFRQVLHDPEASPSLVRKELEQFNRSFFSDILSARGLMTQAELREVSQRLDAIRKDLLREMRATEAALAHQQLRQRVETYLKFTPKDELFSNMGDRAFQTLLEDSISNSDYSQELLGQLDRMTLLLPLNNRNDISAAEAEQILNRLDPIVRKVSADAEGLQQAAKVRLEQQQQKLEEYLRNTGKAELNPAGIKRDLKTLLDEPEAGIQRVRARLAEFDRDTLVQLLSQRRDLSEAEVNDVIDQVESNWSALLNAPASLSAQAQQQYDQATTSIENYLRSTGKPELNPDGIKRDLQKLMDDPKVGASAIRDRLSKMDRDTLVQLLSQRDDLSEAEVNQVIDQIQDNIQQVLKAPQRLAKRVQVQAQDFQTTVEDYLRSTDKAELNPKGIKRDLQMLLDDPRLGAERIGDRLAKFDRGTLVALLSQREDLSEAEINQVIDQILSVRDQIQSQIEAIKNRIESVIDSIFARIRDYLNRLDRPELNYEGLKRDFRTLFDDPQAGTEALRERLSRFDRDTLVAVVSSHDAIAESDANRVIDQIEAARDSVLHKAERIEGQLQQRLGEIKYQTQRQFEATQKSAVAASWWLFLTAFLSGCAAAGAGFLAAAG
ncbi:MAG: MFS transporter [Thermosynechococcaceae cyanobacterium]